MTEINFEEAIKKLEDEVKRLENGNMSLDESIASFEEAGKLVKISNEKLEKAERKVALLTEMSDGTVTDLPFIIDDET